MLEWIASINGATPAFFLSVVTAACGLYHYITIKKSEEAARRFTTYHKMIQDLNVGDDGEAQYIDRQMAIVYEMRNFPEYYAATLRILNRSLPKWRLLKLTHSGLLSTNPLSDEAELTIRFIQRKLEEKSYLCLSDEDRS